MFDEMTLVVDKHIAIGGFFKEVDNIGVEALDNLPPLINAGINTYPKRSKVDPSKNKFRH